MLLTHVVSPEEDGLTLQALLRGPLRLSQRQALAAKREDRVRVDGMPSFSNRRVRAGQRVSVELGGFAQEKAPGDQASGALQKPVVLYEDGALLAAFKPPMLQCHPSPSAPGWSDTLEARVRAYLGASAHPVHRLDAETSGIVLFAKLPYAQAVLQRQFSEGAVQKTYLAWVFGRPEPARGMVDAPIARSEPDSFTRVVRADGQRAVTEYDTLRTAPAGQGGLPVSLVSLHPVTGRTHQLRVHMAHIGCPLLGDARYGTEESGALSRELGLAEHRLCAVSMRFLHPLTGESLSISCPPPPGFSPL